MLAMTLLSTTCNVPTAFTESEKQNSSKYIEGLLLTEFNYSALKTHFGLVGPKEIPWYLHTDI